MPQKKPRTKSSDLFAAEPVFARFMKSDTQSVKNMFQTLTMDRGQVFSFQQMNLHGIYIILSGILKVELAAPTPRILRLATAGDMVGFGWWVMPSNTVYQITALGDSKVQFWTRSAIEEMMRKDPNFNSLIIDHLISVLLHKDQRIVSLESQSVEERVLRLLSWLENKFGRKNENEILIDVQLDRQSLAQLAGTIPETFSRVITGLEEIGIIRRQRRLLVIKDSAKLQKRLKEISDWK